MALGRQNGGKAQMDKGAALSRNSLRLFRNRSSFLLLPFYSEISY